MAPRAIASILFPVDGSPSDLWEPGPLPIDLPDGRRVDARLRATYFQSLASDALYGSESPVTRRQHLVASGKGPNHAVLTGAELLRIPHWGLRSDAPSWLATLHFDLGTADPIEGLASLVHLEPDWVQGIENRTCFEDHLGSDLRISAAWRRAISVSFMDPTSAQCHDRCVPAGWDALTTWLWLGASATPLDSFIPDTDDPALLAGLIYLSSAWRALVLRDGASFVVKTPNLEADMVRTLAAYVQTIYTDVYQLAILQQLSLEVFANQLSRIGSRFSKSEQLRALVNAVTEFRNVMWWEDVTQHGVANELLRRIHGAKRTNDLFERVTADLAAFHAQVEMQAAEEQSELQRQQAAAQKQEEYRARRFDRSASVAAIAFGLPVLVFTAMSLPISGVTTAGHSFQGWQVVLMAVGLAALGLLVGIGAGPAMGLVRQRVNRLRHRGTPGDI